MWICEEFGKQRSWPSPETFKGKRVDGRNPVGSTQKRKVCQDGPCREREAGATCRGLSCGLPARVRGGKKTSRGAGLQTDITHGHPGGPLPESVGAITGGLWRVHKHPETERPAFNYLPPVWVTGPVHQLITLKTWFLFSDSLSPRRGQGSTVRKKERKNTVDKWQTVHLPYCRLPSPKAGVQRRSLKQYHTTKGWCCVCFLSSNWTSVYSKMNLPEVFVQKQRR